MNLEEAIERAAKDLPEGYQITVFVERGSVTVKLVTPDLEESDIDGTDMTLADMVREATESANARELTDAPAKTQTNKETQNG